MLNIKMFQHHFIIFFVMNTCFLVMVKGSGAMYKYFRSWSSVGGGQEVYNEYHHKNESEVSTRITSTRLENGDVFDMLFKQTPASVV